MVAYVSVDGGILFQLSAVLKQCGLGSAGKDLKQGGGAARGRCLHQHQLLLADMGEMGRLHSREPLLGILWEHAARAEAVSFKKKKKKKPVVSVNLLLTTFSVSGSNFI